MTLFKILIVLILIIEITITILIKFNVKGLQDKLYNRVKNNSIETYIRQDYPNRAIISNLILLILIILAIW